MMRLLTGAGTNAEFRFSPRSVDAFGSTVIAEGSADGAGQLLYWVHAWTVGPDGVITQLREYFNTDLTVTRLSAAAATNNASCLWQSRRSDRARKSLPGLVLAI
uniref:Wound-induced protein 1 n=1 Tax=Aegilops tauschii subsp. strangulata TaxID=200361 RepID=A0A453I9J6_AEGTS